mmetsp:Transcript_3862/g.8504  ORF Transcript_3862/g.8504 Transcript_3862/m.8504 type:complete len:311 (+) Transcript_3862:207-1139(+)|eukprot:CAMPEP_0183716982 /NCGR_PEP_ID=MMETSP0737-20130205/10708_1 /TAXON_ID=385413 /ORGANISM="Thalassiosira miniscula, Strain CCMP1093" /LENGTH=310 /DNA_ID=CAMNT_0025946323 /DNA_START=143 /DNA_END=1075 /DNA_ORIENTATION=+
MESSSSSDSDSDFVNRILAGNRHHELEYSSSSESDSNSESDNVVIGDFSTSTSPSFPSAKRRKTEHIKPMDHINQIREQVINGLRSDNDDDGSHNIDQNIIAIRAILATNAEIFDRCMVKTNLEQRKRNRELMKFSRYSFDVVKVYTIRSTIHFATYAERSQKSFFDMTPLMEIPASLDGILSIKRMEKPLSMFIDYASFFEQSLIVHEDVLGPFLLKLKEHLMYIQVRLGEIETWIIKETEIIQYLQATFDKSIKMSELCEHFKSKEPKVLKKYKRICGKPMKIEAEFNIGNGDERKRLEKLLEFTEME